MHSTSATPSTTAVSRSAFSSVPTPTATSQTDVTIDMSSGSGLSFSGSWASSSSSCGSGTSKTVSSDGVTEAQFSELSYSFRGSAIYVKTSSSNANYIIELDGNSTNYGQNTGWTTPPPNCTYGWWLDNLDSTLHFLTISIYAGGKSITKRAVEPFTFELHNFVIAQNIYSSSSSPGATAATSSPTGGNWYRFGFGW
ncbi:hypothetical protein MVEN_01899500 [Mycena venus]|uniref:Uncharacterized protein n=1 Tax=Mycena venus TaxID=2733690 RepID=A0A8H6XG50_9AGAR|nr:hypothetical protein MVEN_01899500 [Mycena venus]